MLPLSSGLQAEQFKNSLSCEHRRQPDIFVPRFVFRKRIGQGIPDLDESLASEKRKLDIAHKRCDPVDILDVEHHLFLIVNAQILRLIGAGDQKAAGTTTGIADSDRFRLQLLNRLIRKLHSCHHRANVVGSKELTVPLIMQIQ